MARVDDDLPLSRHAIDIEDIGKEQICCYARLLRCYDTLPRAMSVERASAGYVG